MVLRIAAVLALAGLATACAPSPTTVSAEALWSLPDTTGSERAGVTRVALEAADPGDGPGGVSIADAGTVGPQWQAAIANGAALGLLAASQSPTATRLSVAVTRNPDGGAAVALMSAMTQAAVTGAQPLQGSTVAAEVLPNGLLVPADGLPAKLSAAAAAGLTTVLVAPGSDVGSGAPPGLTVRPVESVPEAFEVLTDRDPEVTPAGFALDPELDEMVTFAAGQITAQLRVEARRTTGPEQRVLMEAARTSARELASDRPFEAYAVATLAQLDHQIRTAQAAVGPRVRPQRRAMLREVRTLRRSALARLEVGGSTPLDGLEQYPAMADALTWATGTLGILVLAEQQLRAATDQAALRNAAELLARADYRLGTYLPLQIEAVEQIGTTSVTDAAEVLADLTGYAEVLAAAADATLATGAAATAPGYDRAVAQQRVWRRLQVGGGEPVTTLPRLAAALSYFMAAGSAAAGNPADADDLVTRSAVRNDTVMASLAAADLDPSYVAWGNRWGLAWQDIDRSSPRNDGVGATGLTYQWYATINGQILASLQR